MLDNIGYAILDKLSKTEFWRWFTKKYLSGFTTRVFGYPSFPMTDFFKIYDLINRDNIYAFVCSDYSSLGSITIREVADAKFTHAGMISYCENLRDFQILHMRSSGMHKDHILDLLREVDYIAIVEIPLIDGGRDWVVKRMENAWSNKDRYQYDFEEKLENDKNRVYCSEFVLNICGDVCRIKPKTQKILGREVFAPDNILDIGKVVYSNHGRVIRKYLSDPN